tara:strand:- start:1099 stop:3852 length:2754 start_codon:yes stop_codon:yes gene_type:complete
MNDDGMDVNAADARLASLVQFGFPEAAMNDFLSEHQDAFHERLEWLEQRRETAIEIEERLAALSSARPLDNVLSQYATQLRDPFVVEERYVAFERDVRAVAPWEPPLNQSRAAWFDGGNADVWYALYDRLARLDVSSHVAVGPLHRLFSSPERADELLRHLETVEADERRQIQMIEVGAQRLREQGYDVGELNHLPLLEALGVLERWQAFHGQKERVRLGAVQMIQPFDASLAIELEARCHALQHVEDTAAIEDLSNEIQTLAQTLEQRRRALSEIIQGWRQMGIVFPHEGELHPNDLMEWEANHDEVAQAVDRHLSLVERWDRFARYWPSRAEVSKPYVGQLDQSDRLRDAVDEMDALWKKLELDGLELLQTYEHAGLAVNEWQQRVFDDPMSAMERMTIERKRWDERVSLIEALGGLDVSFSGDEDVSLRQQLLAAENVGNDVLNEMNEFVERINRRNERHRVMLEDELAAMRRSGILEHEANTSDMNLSELEHHVALLTRSQGAAEANGQTGVLLTRMRASLAAELESLRQSGWAVENWSRALGNDTFQVARELSDARPHLQRHDVLRRRLGALPWNRDVELGLQVEMMSQQPNRLAYLSQQIPQYTAHLASRTVEDEGYELHLWHPTTERPTLVPIPEEQNHPVLQPSSALEEAHEAMLEAMDTIVDESAHEEDVPATDEATKESEETTEPSVTDPVETEKMDVVQEVEADIEPPTTSLKPKDAATSETESESVATSITTPVNIDTAVATKKALDSLTTLVAVLGLTELSARIEQGGMEALQEVRRGLAGHVNIAPRDVRIGRLLRLSLRLLPEGNQGDNERARLLTALSEMVPTLKRWTRRRLEARHSGSKGNFLDDAMELGSALERIPGLGQHLPLQEDDWPLPSGISELGTEVSKLARSVNLPSAGGVKA